MILKIFFILFFPLLLFSQELHFNKGINLTGWFQTGNVRQVQFSKYTYEDFADIKSLGIDVIRLPISLHDMTDGPGNYIIDPLFYYFLDQIVDWCEDLGINLIIDNHTFDVGASTLPTIDQILIPVWQQMADHYKNRSNLIHYEVLNEPHGISDQRWNEIQIAVVNAIREIDQIHTIIIGPAGWNSYNNLDNMPVYEDNNLIYTFHFYDPFLFTHQGASWTDPPMTSLSDIPFPYNSSEMPPLPPEFNGTWIQYNYNNYFNEGTVSKVQQLLDIAVDFKNSRNVEIFCGELGVLYNNAPEDDRIYWYEQVRSYLEQNNISWTIWDYQGGFGLFEKFSNELFDYDLNIPLLEALGLNIPPQYEYQLYPDSVGFNLYTDFIAKNIFASSWIYQGELDYYNQNDPKNGEFCIYWSDAAQWNFVGFDLKPVKDLSYLFAANYVVDFWVKGNMETTFDIRFIDTKTENPEDHPWRIRYTLSESDFEFDRTWHHIRIPLNEFVEQGSWDNNTWYDPIGAFDWKAIDRFEIVAEHNPLADVELWFDEIKIVEPNASEIIEHNKIVQNFRLYQNYPNPFNPSTTIIFELPKRAYTTLAIYNTLGEKIIDIVAEELSEGLHRYNFDGGNLSSGIYFYRLTSGTMISNKKMILIN